MRSRPLSKDHAGGALMFVVGAATSAFSVVSYPVGTFAQMGAGMFPALLGGLLAAIGGAIFVRGFAKEVQPIEFSARAFVQLVAAVVAFGLLVTYFGFAPAVFGVVILSAMADRQWNWRQSVWLALGMAAFALIVFVWLLGMPLELFRLPGG